MKTYIRPAMLVLAVLMFLLTGCAAHVPAPAAVPVPEETVPSPLSVVAEPGEYDVRIYTIDPDEPIAVPDAPVPLAPAPELSTDHEGPVTKRQAEAIAIAHAGLTQEDVSFLFTKEDHEDGVKVFEVNFRSGYNEYEFEIVADSGEIYSYDKEDIRKD